MHDINMFDRKGPLNLDKFARSGADWMEQYKPYIEDGETVVTSPHKVFGPQTNDLVLQLRKRNIRKVLLAGMSANLCVESHLRDLLEQGFEVGVVTDATASRKIAGIGRHASRINELSNAGQRNHRHSRSHRTHRSLASRRCVLSPLTLSRSVGCPS